MLQPPIESAQYRAIRYGEALAEQDAVTYVGSRGDSYDNALAESLNSLYKAELVRNKGPWKGIDDVEIATAEWEHWFKHVPTSRSTQWGDSRVIPSRIFQHGASGCLARVRADEFQIENSPSNPVLDSVHEFSRR